MLQRKIKLLKRDADAAGIDARWIDDDQGDVVIGGWTVGPVDPEYSRGMQYVVSRPGASPRMCRTAAEIFELARAV